MKKVILPIVCCILLGSCYNKTVQLPEIDNAGITEIKDVSAAYLFYDEETDSVDFNRKNLISTTHWLVNVDKRLTLKQALPSLIYLQDKRSKAGMHKNENARNYFSCSNPEIQNLAFIEFTDIIYQQGPSEEFFLTTSEIPKNINIRLNFSSSEEIKLTSILENTVIKTTNSNNLLNDLKSIPNINNSTAIGIVLDFNENLSFQEYITYKSILLNLDLENVSIYHREFIYN